MSYQFSILGSFVAEERLKEVLIGLAESQQLLEEGLVELGCIADGVDLLYCHYVQHQF